MRLLVVVGDAPVACVTPFQNPQQKSRKSVWAAKRMNGMKKNGCTRDILAVNRDC